MAKKKPGNGKSNPDSDNGYVRTFKNWYRLHKSTGSDQTLRGMMDTAKTKDEWRIVCDVSIVGTTNWEFARQKLDQARD